MTLPDRQGRHPSLESLIEAEDIGVDVLHPGGLEITGELAERCSIGKGVKVLDVASGTGESACFLAETYGCYVTGLDFSDRMVETARRKALERGLRVEFRKGDAHHLPFNDNTFDAVISECTICLLEKERAISEMVRVVRRGGRVGMHDVCWKHGAPGDLRRRLAEIENERPETLAGWKDLFERAGLIDVAGEDRSFVIPEWTRQMKKQLGLSGQFRVFLKVVRRWGTAGLRAVRESEKIFESGHLGYGLVVGKKS
ncbi:MAG: methyltransferase domain-containing protein [Candidatus Sulfobium sp.]|jgi:arsenite methyltransferase